jgi:hypothetical protein
MLQIHFARHAYKEHHTFAADHNREEALPPRFLVVHILMEMQDIFLSQPPVPLNLGHNR